MEKLLLHKKEETKEEYKYQYLNFGQYWKADNSF